MSPNGAIWLEVPFKPGNPAHSHAWACYPIVTLEPARLVSAIAKWPFLRCPTATKGDGLGRVNRIFVSVGIHDTNVSFNKIRATWSHCDCHFRHGLGTSRTDVL